ncbi:hypothetical protein, partial [Mariniflexile sp.]|uniref:hypothetical protein n=1 Tax=Mariniflexile sp. TaxID=1979402 RepID=UPI00404804A2
PTTMKKLILFGIFLFSFFQIFAQNNNYFNRMQYVFGNIDKTKASTGYLKEFGIRFNEVEAYNAVISTNNLVDKTQWQPFLYIDLAQYKFRQESLNILTKT